MQNVFHYENGLMSAIARIADAVTLSVFWVICSLPVFTIGVSISAMHYVLLKIFRDELSGGVIRNRYCLPSLVVTQYFLSPDQPFSTGIRSIIDFTITVFSPVHSAAVSCP